ncbi:excinuclease ABC subunit UvrC [Ectothiorhodospira lacustris]|uniref:excinuclease ABC subunit UvrC n=1 Tax=Ectothiorhodospira lacustris TaxID=2899127 RepID=UPI001EE90A7D|nr:excinuclease ABC subunit UvrC [Ectothiorhodospira lacustris]MCG5500552.1 excinuclease ABC subunit UvrC [Ectothiorhodospira lacustris]MCG5509375.1 excinuclease ABC subunit UvrC [Ectothiorhodospira lacustris]MCG5521429.1 excinuclease ABC subunit UvrC [Ectothiorhodospira lacustris]
MIISEGSPSEAFDPRRFLADLTTQPGVYQMLGEGGVVLYVGKAKNLKKRVSSYFRRTVASPRIAAMVARIRDVQVIVTRSEAEALLLENNLIKEQRPRYNIIFRDDKSYPYIFISRHDYPRLAFHRGARKAPGRYFGPYPSGRAVRETIHLLQRLFLIRPCEDSFFQNRSRACLQHQIQRCSGPCVGLIDPVAYAADVAHAVDFLEGRSEQVIADLVQAMERAAAALDYEHAARVRDQIARLRQLSERQYVSGEGGDVDIIAIAREAGEVCVQVFSIRGGLNLGNRSLFPRVPEETASESLMTAFLGQFYLSREVPPQVILSHEPEDRAVLQDMLTLRRGQRVTLSWNVRGDRARWLEMATRNAQMTLATRLAGRAGMRERLEALQDVLDLDEPPQRMECFDISHTQGEATVASCVVFDGEGPVKSDYRRFNIKDITPGDDYAAMRQALMRRYTRLKAGEGKLPDILFIDGGKGQVRQALEVLETLQVSGVMVVGVAKGEDRRPGTETLILSDAARPSILPPGSRALHLIQQIRDEAHRFAITGHRQRRAKARSTSPLEQIHGMGPKRRQQLLKHFGGLQGVCRADVEALAKVPGISRKLAQQIFDSLHDD